MPLETEIKLRIPSCEGLALLLPALSFREVVPTQEEISVLWDRGDELLAAHSALRLRTFAGGTRLTWKGPRVEDPLLKIRPELETGVEDGEALEGILRALDYQPVLRMVKTRSVWIREEAGEATPDGANPDSPGRPSALMACLDRTPFGDYLELEGNSQAIRCAMEALSLTAAHAEPRSYPMMWRAAGVGGGLTLGGTPASPSAG